ncbi:MAG: hypothetical protein HY619_07290 [Thaumarchaeota archaeon]|nr:hypothetical protein [Nitrososphaerota archaeon]
MDRNLMALVILTAFSKREQPLDQEFAIALLSTLLNENIDEEKFNNIISVLAEMGYVVPGSNPQASTRGVAVAETLGGSSLNRYDVEFVEKNTERFIASPPDSRRDQTEALLSAVSRRTLFSGRPVEKIPSEKFISNSVKVTFAIKTVPLVENYFDEAFIKGMRSAADRYRTLGWIERGVEEKFGAPAAVKLTADGFVVYSSAEVDAARASGLDFTRARFERKQSIEDLPEAQRAFADKALNIRFREKGFSRTAQGRRFINFQKYDTEITELGTFRLYHGFNFRLDYTSSVTAVAWFDPISKVVLTIHDYVEHLRRQGLSEREISDELLGKSVRVLPSGSKGEIVRLNEMRLDTAKELVPGTKTTYAEYWNQRHRFKLTNELQQTVEVQLGDSGYNYPVETAYFDRDELETLSSTPLTLEPTSLDPVDRVKKTEQLVSQLLDNPIEDTFFNIQFGRRLLNWSELEAEKFCSGLSRLSPPSLHFNIIRQMTEVSSDPRSIFKYGPYSKEKSVSVVVVLVPATLPDESIRRFFENLNASYKRLYFGNLKFSPSSILKYSNKIERSKLPNLLESKRVSVEGQGIALVVLPPNRFDLYLPTKEEIFRRWSVPAQVLLTSTFERIARGEVGPTRGTILQLYTKLIRKKEAAWILAEPADRRMETMYVGIGFSATPYTEHRANSFAAMCDSKGGDIDWKPIGIPFGGRYIDEKWFTGFLGFVQDNLRAGVKRIVVFRKGDTYEDEIEAMQKVVSETRGRPWEDFNFVSILNEGRRIFSLGEVLQNPESGVFARVNNKEALLVCSLQHAVQLQQGTAIPVRLVRAIGSSDIEGIVSEYRALTYLNWAAPITSSKYPLVVNIANRIAQLVKELTDIRMLEAYLPL